MLCACARKSKANFLAALLVRDLRQVKNRLRAEQWRTIMNKQENRGGQDKGKQDPNWERDKKNTLSPDAAEGQECGKCQDPMAKPDKAQRESAKKPQETA